MSYLHQRRAASSEAAPRPVLSGSRAPTSSALSLSKPPPAPSLSPNPHAPFSVRAAQLAFIPEQLEPLLTNVIDLTLKNESYDEAKVRCATSEAFQALQRQQTGESLQGLCCCVC